jgi:sec-independent protein translocase protein TatC
MTDKTALSQEQPLLAHLLELRTRFIHAILGILAVFIPCAIFSNRLYDWASAPLTKLLPKGASMIATGVISPFVVPLKLAAIAALLLAAPWVLFQIWRFVAPGLYNHEKRMAAPILVVSVLLFYAGVAFAYFITLPMVFKFSLASAPDSVQVATDIGQYLDFIMMIFLAFGLTFEVPIVVVVLVWLGATNVAQLKEARGYVVVGIFIVAAIITPPDVASQLLVAIPACLLFEAGLIWARFVENRRKEPRLL